MAKAKEAPTGVGVKDLLEAGVHFGHQTKRWNPKMKKYIFDKRNGIHIIDLAKSAVLLNKALEFMYEVAAKGKSVLFVGTKKQAQQAIQETAEACGQFFVVNRWLGGTLTNRKTIRNSIQRMRDLMNLEKSEEYKSMPKKEVSVVRRELNKLKRNLSGIADMEELPGVMFVVDINREAIAVNEAKRLGIPVIAMVDTCCDPDPIDFVIPSNDDAIRAIRLIATAATEAIKKGVADYSIVAAEIAKKKAEEAQKRAEEEAKVKAAAAEKAEAARVEKKAASKAKADQAKKEDKARKADQAAGKKGEPKKASAAKEEKPVAEVTEKPAAKKAEKKEDAPAEAPKEEPKAEAPEAAKA